MRTPIALAAAALAAGMAAPDRAAAQVPAGGEFQANTYTTAAQAAVAIAEAPDGRFVVVWNSLDYASGGDVIARRYDAAGVAQGAAFRVNTYTTAFQAQPAVAMDRRGNFAVVWASYGQTGSGHEVFGQLFDSAGAPIGGEFQVNTATTGTQYLPAVAMAPGGAFVVAWEDYSQGPPNLRYVVSARRFDAGANAQGAEFVANTYTAAGSFQFYPSVGMDDSGAFVVAWESDALSGTPQDGSGGGVFGQRFGAAGNRIGAEFRVNAYTTGRQGRPAVAVAPDGRFLVAWDSAQDGGSTGILAQRFDASGTPAGGELLVNTYTTGLQADTSVRADARGNFVVAWESTTQDGDALGVFGQRLDANGARRGNEFRANSTATGSQDNGAVGVDSVGNFTLAWESPQDGSSDAAMARRFGGLFPRPMAVDPAGNGVMEPGETAVVRPSWQNLNGTAQAFGSTLSALTGPAGATYTINDGSASYGSVPDGATQACVDCFAVTAAAATRPVQHWDATALETINPVSQGQQKQWTLHVGASFADVGPTSPFYRFVETLLHHAVTGGCTATDYCPASATTREQMAVLVLVAREGAGYAPPACATPPFNDVPVSSGFCRFVAELARRGVVSGCGGGNFCPTADVTRAQMAVFVLRTLDPQLSPPGCVAGTELFNDVPASSGFCPWVEELARRGVVSGCGGGAYCPDDPVTRGQMGVFLSVTFGLALYGA